ncbi:MAG: Unknown protein [uncultured Thiotrichaceae bacterium]|uniref:SPOR domain-containing protein n=1 Tax=uncultured Thiotrichaceae bacterium TaxID=298394 RepID=A0A6S6SXE1_9GAMM|nr:MAG: Unknown protein [uncultured Thiotrichaceae bacterium]
MQRSALPLPSRQRGITFWHVLLLVVIAVSLAVCAKNQSIPYLQRPLSDIKIPTIPQLNFQNDVPARRPAPPSETDYSYSDEKRHNTSDDNVEWLLTSNNTRQVKAPPNGSSYELQYPRNLTSGFYTVQVLSGYNSKSAYTLRDALRNDGYKAYIHQETDKYGILFKVRVGQYKNRADAFAMNTKLRLSYPKTIKGSFVLLRQ